MRYVMKEASREQVPLRQELEYVSHYISLQKLRVATTAQVVYQPLVAAGTYQIAPLLLVPFVENTFKYGVNPEEESVIKIEITQQNDQLTLYAFNRKVRIFQDEENASGIGLRNTRARLEHLYPGRHQLTIRDTAHDYTVELTLQLA